MAICPHCGREIPDDVAICPYCGEHIPQKFELTLHEKLELHEQIRIKQKAPHEKKPSIEIKAGDELYNKENKWVHREMKINRKHDEYEEIVRDKETGEIIHKNKEPLSQHIGHGSAKKAKKRGNGK